MRKVGLLFCALLLSVKSFAAFDGKEIPKNVRVLPCDSNPRIVVIFEDQAKNIWYPLNGSDSSKSFLSIAISAQVSKVPMFFLGSGSATDLTSYCIATSARRVDAFGLN